MPTPQTTTTDRSVAVLIAPGCEEVEALAVVDCLYRAGMRADLIAVGADATITSSHGVRIVCDLLLDEADLAAYTVLFLPGGMPGTLNLAADTRITEEVARRVDADLPVAAICAAPSILANAGLLRGRRATANPGFMNALVEGGADALEDPVVVDGQILTSRGMGTAADLGIAIVRHLLGDDAADAVAEGIVRR